MTITHNGYPVKIIISIIKDGADTKFGMFFQPTLDPVDEKLDLTVKFGFINGNDNMCREATMNHTYSRTDSDSRGIEFHKTNNAAAVARVAQHYDVNNEIIFGAVITKLTASFDNDKLLRRIYRTVKGDGVKKLEDQIVRQGKTIVRQLKAISRLEEDLEKAHTKIALAASTSLSTCPADSSPVLADSPTTLRSPATLATPLSLDEQLSTLDPPSLLETQKKITELIQMHNQCKICLDNSSTMMIIPCGHKCCCDGCSEKLAASTKLCPICRTPVDKFVKVF